MTTVAQETLAALVVTLTTTRDEAQAMLSGPVGAYRYPPRVVLYADCDLVLGGDDKVARLVGLGGGLNAARVFLTFRDALDFANAWNARLTSDQVKAKATVQPYALDAALRRVVHHCDDMLATLNA